MKEPQNNILTIMVGGAAGDGTRALGSNLFLFFIKNGFETFASADYPSLIRGGHNFSRITFSDDRVYNDYSAIDILIAFNEETIQLHRSELKEGSVILADSFTEEEPGASHSGAVLLPMKEFAKEIDAPQIARSSVAFGAVCYLLGLPFEKMEEVLREVFKEKGLDVNIRLAQMGYDHLKASGTTYPRNFEPKQEGAEALDASSTFSRGLVKAGLDFYVAYPMTPASPILHFLAKNQKDMGIKVIHPESELSVINMALGIAYTGKKTAIGTSGGGFALMQESFSLAGMSETPLVVAMVSRQSPASGVPTYTSQADMLFILNSGHGEFPRIVLAPGDAEEAFYAGADSLNLAWKYQIPVIVLTDKHIGESVMSGRIDEEKVGVEEGKIAEAENVNSNYKRYQFTEDGVSPLAFAGTADAVVKATSYEHDEKGITTEDSEATTAMYDKRFAKSKEIEKEFEKYDTVKIYGDTESKNVVVFWGSTKGAVLEAAKYLEHPAKLLQILWLEPLDVAKVTAELQDAEMIVDVEGNHNAQLASLIRQKTGIEIKEKILRYDARPFDPLPLAEELNALLK
jgi:2-oxoglutarate ferredoxin oxidoreductase subunit alpha